MTFSDKRILAGVISSPHGIKGNVIIKSLTSPAANLESLKLFDEQGIEVKIKVLKTNPKNFVICNVEGVADRNEAEKLKKLKLFTLKEALPEEMGGEFYAANLLNLKILDEEKVEIGMVKAFFNFGAGDLLEIEYNDGGGELLPFTEELFPEIGAEYLTLNLKIWKSKS